MAFPDTVAPTVTAFGTPSTNHDVEMPPTVDADDLLIVIIALNAATSVTPPSGWTEKSDETDATGNVTLASYVKKADGTEDGTDVDFVSAEAKRGAAHAYRVTGWSGDINDVEVSAFNDGVSSTADPLSLTLAVGSGDNLWLSISCMNGNQSVSSQSSGYITPTTTASGGPASATMHSSERDVAAASENPGTITWGDSDEWAALTMGIPPATAGGVDVEATPSPVAVGAQAGSPVLSALAVTAVPSLASVLGSVVNPTLAQLDVQSVPAPVAVGPSAPVLALAQLATAVSPSLVSPDAQAALLALAQLDVQSVPSPVTVVPQPVNPITGGVLVNLTPSLLAINAQIASAVLDALAVTATPAPVGADPQVVDPTPSALAVNASPAALAVIAQAVQATLAAFSLSAASAPVGIDAQVVDPVEAALALNASPAALNVIPSVVSPVAGSVAINADPAVLAVSPETVSAVLSALATQASPALLNAIAQGASPVISGGAINATPAPLTAKP